MAVNVDFVVVDFVGVVAAAEPSSNFIFSDSQSLAKFGKLQKRCLEVTVLVMIHDLLPHKPYLDIHHHQNLESRELCPSMDSK